MRVCCRAWLCDPQDSWRSKNWYGRRYGGTLLEGKESKMEFMGLCVKELALLYLGDKGQNSDGGRWKGRNIEPGIREKRKPEREGNKENQIFWTKQDGGREVWIKNVKEQQWEDQKMLELKLLEYGKHYSNSSIHPAHGLNPTKYSLFRFSTKSKFSSLNALLSFSTFTLIREWWITGALWGQIALGDFCIQRNSQCCIEAVTDFLKVKVRNDNTCQRRARNWRSVGINYLVIKRLHISAPQFPFVLSCWSSDSS